MLIYYNSDSSTRPRKTGLPTRPPMKNGSSSTRLFRSNRQTLLANTSADWVTASTSTSKTSAWSRALLLRICGLLRSATIAATSRTSR